MISDAWRIPGVAAVLAVLAAAIGVAVLLLAGFGGARAYEPRIFTLDDGSCPHQVTFQGKTLNPDGSTTWSYLVEDP